MIKRFVPMAMASMALFSLNACKNNSFKKTKDGLEYKIVKDEKGGKNAAYGDIIEMHLHIHLGDSVLFDSRKMNNNQALQVPLMPANFKGDWPEGVTMMSPGDSAQFLVSVDSIKKMAGGNLPPWMKAGQKISYDVVLVSVKSQEEMKKEEAQKAAGQMQADDKILQDYFTANSLHPSKTETGLYYIIDQPGSGATVQNGQTAVVMYTGKTLDGKTFDSNIDPQFSHTEPLSVTVGTNSVIPGWEEGLRLLKKGSKAKLFIPSPLAYGSHSPGPGIPANSVLMFDVEVKDVKDGQPAEQQPVQ